MVAALTRRPAARAVAASSGGRRLVLLEGITRTFGRSGRSVRVLDGLSLEVPPGAAVGLVGPNGAGKSTALRIVAGLLAPDGGRAVVLGRDIANGARPPRRAMGVSLGFERSFYWRLTARRNLHFAGRLLGLTGRRLVSATEAALAEMGLSGWGDEPARKLSRGALARLSLARALLGDPVLLVLDEPLASVDSGGRRLGLDALALRLRAGSGAVVATHDPTVAAWCGSVVALSPREVVR